MNGDNYDSYFCSPLVSKGITEQRHYFTEAKVPFKNSTNDRNLPCFTENKAANNAKFNDENLQRSFNN